MTWTWTEGLRISIYRAEENDYSTVTLTRHCPRGFNWYDNISTTAAWWVCYASINRNLLRCFDPHSLGKIMWTEYLSLQDSNRFHSNNIFSTSIIVLKFVDFREIDIPFVGKWYNRSKSVMSDQKACTTLFEHRRCLIVMRSFPFA